ncbi:D-alanine--poly(phosphoribitol) ligase subunit 2 [Veillonellaceae bacterium WCA-693-APC-5D-A]|uniref:D-alanine--poly(Phosphoribitol) ligase subunit 2 n=2 Tax=Anaerovibrio slackiae TaxID=2652309 RepID=A0A6I2UDK7_9FIRM|nr:D-alanine--poly(phosphoribitol) ligase subunit 2 [Anaerovibrio slackiae]
MAVEILEQVSEMEGLSENSDLDLFEAGLLDSLAVISVIVQIEARTGIRLQPTDFKRDDIASVEKLTKFLENRGIKDASL